MEERLVLKKQIGVFKGASIIIGVVLGSGIFVSPVGVLRYSKSVGMSLLMWLISGLISTLGAIVYAELGVTIPRSGGEYAYIFAAFGPVLAFMSFWNTFILIGGVGCAANAIAFAQYLLKAMFMDCEIPTIPQNLVAVCCLLLIAFINGYSARWATKIAIIFTICKISALVIIVGIGAYYLCIGRVENFENAFDNSDYSVGAMAFCFYQGIWAYGGWNYLNFLTEEIKNPAKNLPLAILVSMGTIITIYLCTNVAYLAVLSPHEMLQLSESSSAIAVSFAFKTLGSVGYVVPFFVSASIFGSVNGEMLSMSRLCATGAEDKHLPEYLAMINYNLITPVPAVMCLLVFALGFLFYQDLDFLIELCGFAFVVVSCMAVCALLYFRHKNPSFNGGFKLPLIMPILYLIINVGVGVLTVYQKPYESGLAVLMMFIGLVYYILWWNQPQIVKRKIRMITRTLQKLTLSVEQQKSEQDPYHSTNEMAISTPSNYESSSNGHAQVTNRNVKPANKDVKC